MQLITDATHSDGERAGGNAGDRESTIVSSGAAELRAGDGDLRGCDRLTTVGVDDATGNGIGGLGCERGGSSNRQREPEQGGGVRLEKPVGLMDSTLNRASGI